MSSENEVLNPNQMYCDRLVELAFPPGAQNAQGSETVAIEGKRYSRGELREELEKNPALEQQLRRKYRWARAGMGRAAKASSAELDGLVDITFEPRIEVGAEEYTRDDLVAELPKNPKLQKLVGVKLHFVPSKWLLEQEIIAKGVRKPDVDIYTQVANLGLIGVCFSGGGIRSATFNLGVIQGLAQVGLLPHIDYLSSVSGGGYIHEFLAAWILRNPKGCEGVVAELIPQAEPKCLPRSPEPIKWLMRYASYLTPRRGPFSTDTWTMVAIWFRNTILNQIPILSGLAFACLVVRLLVSVQMDRSSDFWTKQGTPGILMWSGQGLVGALAMYFAIRSLFKLCDNLLLQREMHGSGSKSASMSSRKLLTNRDVQVHVIAPWLALSIWLSYWMQWRLNPDAWLAAWLPWIGFALFCLWVLALVMMIIFAGGAMDCYDRLNPHPLPIEKRFDDEKKLAKRGFILTGFLTSVVASALGWVFVVGSGWLAHLLASSLGPVRAVKQAAQQTLNFTVSGGAEAFTANLAGALSKAATTTGGIPIDPWRIELAFLPGLLLSVPYVAVELMLGLLGRDYPDIRREWLARLRAWSLLYGLLWGALTSVALLSPYVVYWLIGIGPKAVWSAVVTFLIAHGTTIFAGWSGKADGKPTDKGILGFKPVDLLAILAAPVTILGILVAVSFTSSWILDHFFTFGGQMGPYWLSDIVCAIWAGLIALLFGWRVDINEFSMQSFYRNRLSRCYLGATVAERQEDPFTGFDEREELTLINGKTQRTDPNVADLLPKKYRSVKRVRGEYDGPFPIFCTTLNLTTGDDLATQERKGASFAFTPLYSGYSVSWTDADADSAVSYNGYVPTEYYAYPDGGISLDTAVAISGAAVNPNMGYNSNPTLAFLMTFFNVRLGWWISNTRKTDQWQGGKHRATPQFAAWYLFQELFGKVNDAAPYVNLSDGGHFENMGLYELVRRRCRYIIVCDAEEDPDMHFEGIGAAITKCRADFGAEIDLDLRPLQKDDKTGYSNAHCVVGTIQYPPPPGAVSPPDDWTPCKCLGDRDDDLYSGYVVYMKSSLVGDEPPDLLTYQLKHAVFPQDSTADQWFQETQFEAYRRLGHHIAMATIPPALQPGEPEIKDPGDIPELFRRMNAIWYPRTPEMEQYLGDHLKQYEAILKDLRERAELAGLEEALMDTGTDAQVAWASVSAHAGNLPFAMQYANSILRFVYTVYTNLQLAFPDNRTSPHAVWWICLFRRWCRVDVMRQSWTAHAPTYPEEFLLFARRELRLP